MLREKITNHTKDKDPELSLLLDEDFDPQAPTLVVDLDNTLFGAMQALEQELPWYFIEGQTKYVFQECWEPSLAKEALSLFHDPDVLRAMPVIPEVEDMIAAMMKERHSQILIVSKTKSMNMELRYELVKRVERIAPYVKGIVVWQKQHPLRELRKEINIKSIIDDNPANLKLGQEEDIFTIKVSYPYNEDVAADLSVYPSSVFTRYRTAEKFERIEEFKESRLGARERYGVTSRDFLKDLQSLCQAHGFQGGITLGIENEDKVLGPVETWGRGDLLYTETLTVRMTRINRVELSAVQQEEEN